MIEEPDHLTILELSDVEHLEFVLNNGHFLRNLQLWCIFERPVTVCQDFSIKLDVVNSLLVSIGCLEVFHDILRFNDILEHYLHLADCGVTAFDLELLKHFLLG